jgi:tetratricopeptide (TPR) repeat protein
VVGLALAACAQPVSPPQVTAANEPPTAAVEASGSAVVVGASSSGNYLAGRYAHRQRDFSSAADFMSKALADDPENLTLMRSAYRLSVANGMIAESLPLARRIVALEPNALLPSLGLAADEVKFGRFDDANRRLTRMPVQGFNAFFVPIARAWTLVGLGRHAEAVAALGPVTSLPGFAVVHDLHVGLIEDLAGRPDAALVALKKAESANSQSALRIVEALGSLYERTGRGAEARALYEKYISENPDTVVLEPHLARLAQGDRARPMVATAQDGLAEALLNIGGILTREQTAEISMISGHLALYVRPDLDLARMMIGGVLESQGRIAEANEAYAAVSPSSPLSWLARLRRGANLDADGKTDQAIAELQAMANEETSRIDALVNLGDLLRSRKRFAESVEAYDGAFARIPQVTKRHWSLLYSRGIALERSNQWARAESDLLKALDLNPDEPYVLNYLGYSWTDQGIHLDRARKMIERAVELRPTDGYIVDSLGWVYYRRGDYPSAVKQLERAVELKPQDPVINDHLGDAYWRVGRKEEARYQWRRALGLDPEPDLAETIRGKLVRGLGEVKKSESATAKDI